MKTLGIICGGVLAIAGSLAALYRYWLIMTFGAGFAAVGDERLYPGAKASLLAGSIGLLLSLATVGGYLYLMLSRRHLFTRNPYSFNSSGLRSA